MRRRKTRIQPLKSRELFIPDAYREEVLGFVQSSVVRKEEIGCKITGDGLIAITNFHKLFDKSDDKADEDVTPLEDPSQAV